MMKPKILYVDDEPINLRLFEINFSKKYNVVTCTSASQGLKTLAHEADFAVIISDMKMPEMNGIEFITKAKEMFPALKSYIVSGFDMTNEIRESLNSGIILKYFQKPFAVTEIEMEMEAVLK